MFAPAIAVVVDAGYIPFIAGQFVHTVFHFGGGKHDGKVLNAALLIYKKL